MSFITVVCLLCIQAIAVYSQVQATQTCSNKETRKAAVNDALTHRGCEDYNCAIQEFLYLGLNESNPAISCAEIFKKKLSAPTGYYWLQSDNGSAVHVFCDMTLTCKGVGGGWMQVAKLNMTNSSHQCLPGTRLRLGLPERPRVCGRVRNAPGCNSSNFNVHGIRYSQVCGRIIGYQFVSPDAFGAYYSSDDRESSSSIDGNYVDGISLTHGRNPREHIWTFAGGLSETGSAANLNCPCTNSSQAEFATQPPSFVGNDYFCDTGSTNRWEHRFTQMTPYGMELVVDQITPAAL